MNIMSKSQVFQLQNDNKQFEEEKETLIQNCKLAEEENKKLLNTIRELNFKNDQLNGTIE